MKVLRIFQLLAQLLIFLGALSIGAIGFFKIDILQAIIAKGSLKYLQMSIGLSALFLIVLRFI
jgi:uncharacterized membrane protein YuzA (DUF378 family)